MNYIKTSNNIVTFGVVFDGKLLGDRYSDFNKLLDDLRSFFESLSLRGYETFVIFAVHINWFKQSFPKRVSTLYYGEDWQKVFDDLISESYGNSEENNRI